MYGQNILLFASLMLSIIATPIPLREANNREVSTIDKRGVALFPNIVRDLFKRHPVFEALPNRPVEDIADRTKRSPVVESNDDDDTDKNSGVSSPEEDKEESYIDGSLVERRPVKLPGGGKR